LAPDFEYIICKGIKFIYLSDMARFLQENYSCIYSEGSDQNFDEETKGIGESRRGCSQKRLKSYKVMRDDQVVLSAKAECQKVGGLIASNKPEDKYNGTSKVDARSLDAEARSPMCKNDGSKG
jgi:hypothetical protein